MKTIILLFLFIINLNLNAQTGQYVPELALFDSKMQQILTAHEIQGGQLAITYEGRLVYNRGFGLADSAENALVQPTSIFRLASLSKSITSIAVMKLFENGLLSLDAKVLGVNGILDDTIYQCAIDARMYDFTVRQLLNHSAGFNFVFATEPLWKTYDIAIAMGVPPPTYSFEMVLQWTLQNETLGYDPGTSAFYSNFGYTLLGLVVEKVTGMEYEDYVRDSILIPLGITDMHAGKTLQIDKYPNEVTYYDYEGAPLATSIFTGIPNSVPAQYGGYNWEIMTPAGGWVASAQDLCRLLVAVDRFTTKPDILLPATIDTMLQNSIHWPDYALGWFVNGNNYWNNGGIQGTATTFECDGTHELTYTILFNSLPYNYAPFYDAFVHLVTNEFSNIQTWPDHDLFDPLTSEKDLKVPAIINIYPSPAKDFISIDCNTNSTQVIQFIIYSSNGTIVQKGQLIEKHEEMKLNLPNGMYFYRATDMKQISVTGKLLIQK